MESFNQLFNRFVQRSGISDSELARAVGVSRQTIFRWREGQTGRPRQREDVLAIAGKLRLTPEERDLLLLAAGFQPERIMVQAHKEVERPAIPEAELSERLETGKAQKEEGAAGPSLRFRLDGLKSWPWTAAVVGAVLLLIGSLAWWAGRPSINGEDARLSTVALEPGALVRAPAVTPAAAGETMVLVTHFANYASSQVGYNVAGRLAEALQREIDDLRLQHSRVAIWPEVVAEQGQALEAGRATSATLVIYGEYDAGRIVVKFTQPADQASFAGPALQRYVAGAPELSAIINSDLPQQVRSLALMALGQIYLTQNEAEQARLLLAQARSNLQNDPAIDRQTWALVNFHLGAAYHHSRPPALDEAITAYGEAIAAWPEMISSRFNRAAAYEARNQPGDLELALLDADEVVRAVPDWALGYNNRASIRTVLGGPENLSLALADLEKALALAPDLPVAYFNRAYLRLAQGRQVEEAAPDLLKALALRPNYGAALNMLCWSYAVEQQPETALPYCQEAVAAEPDQPEFQDSRGLAYALLGDYPAAMSDFKAYAAWLEKEKPYDDWQPKLARRSDWIEALAAGENPFTAELLAELRDEFGQ
jgi:tetratricopeptide (TPR) repeat protein/transcriptional regulator with XRE-family HTH domain